MLQYLNIGPTKLKCSIELNIRIITGVKTFYVGEKVYFEHLLNLPSAFVCADPLIKAGRKLPVKPRMDCFYYFTDSGPAVPEAMMAMRSAGLLVASS